MRYPRLLILIAFGAQFTTCTSSKKAEQSTELASAAQTTRIKDPCVNDFNAIVSAIGLTQAVVVSEDTMRFTFTDSTTAIATNKDGWHFTFSGSDSVFTPSLSESNQTIVVDAGRKGRPPGRLVLFEGTRHYCYPTRHMRRAVRSFELRQVITCPDLMPYLDPAAPAPVGYIGRTVQPRRQLVNDSLGVVMARRCGPGNSIIQNGINLEHLGFVHFVCAGKR